MSHDWEVYNLGVSRCRTCYMLVREGAATARTSGGSGGVEIALDTTCADAQQHGLELTHARDELLCHNCHAQRGEHTGRTKCLYGPTTFYALACPRCWWSIIRREGRLYAQCSCELKPVEIT